MNCPHCQPTSNRKSTGPNFLALSFSLLGISVLYYNFDPNPAGSNISNSEEDFSGYMVVVPNAQMKITKPQTTPNQTTKRVPVQTASIETENVIPGASAVIVSDQTEATPPLAESYTGQEALNQTVSILNRGLQYLESVPNYSATFLKQERVGGTMPEPNKITVKIRHEPYSVYMKWHNGDKGRELLYVDGENNGDMVVRVGGWKGRMLPALNLNPTGSIAMKESRHPVTDMGIKKLIEKALKYRESDLERSNDYTCQLDTSVMFNKQECYQFTINYNKEVPEHDYSKSVLLINKKMNLPVTVQNFGWPDKMAEYDPERPDETSLLENYTYANLKLDTKLAKADFSRKNKKYNFVR